MVSVFLFKASKILRPEKKGGAHYPNSKIETPHSFPAANKKATPQFPGYATLIRLNKSYRNDDL